MYDLTTSGPTNTETRRYPASTVLHTRFATEPARPWQGLGPLYFAALSGTLAARLEAALGEEASVATLRYLVAPTGWDDNRMNVLKAQVEAGLTAPNKLTVVESVRQAGGMGHSNAPAKDLEPMSLGPNPAEASVTLYQAVSSVVLDCCGIPSALGLTTGSTGATLREAWRLCVATTVQPLADLIAAEASRVLERPVAISLHRLSTLDIRSKAQALVLLMDEPVKLSKAEAFELVGLDLLTGKPV